MPLLAPVGFLSAQTYQSRWGKSFAALADLNQACSLEV